MLRFRSSLAFNLILSSNATVKLIDFNVAKQVTETVTATVVGKHAYIPIEQFRGRATMQSDIFALGCTLHYLRQRYASAVELKDDLLNLQAWSLNAKGSLNSN